LYTPQRVRLALWAGVAAAALLNLPAQAGESERLLPDLSDRYIPPRPADDTLYRALGGEAGLQRVAEDFLKRLLVDARVARFFTDRDPQVFIQQMAVQLCEVSGGPCTHKRNMRRLHSSMDIGKAQFNAVVEVLQQTLDAQGIAFAVQNRLLAQLAPMHRDIVNVDPAP
jgi:hemoglobin